MLYRLNRCKFAGPPIVKKQPNGKWSCTTEPYIHISETTPLLYLESAICKFPDSTEFPRMIFLVGEHCVAIPERLVEPYSEFED